MRRTSLVAVVLILLGAAFASAQAPPDDDAVWRAFITWFRTAPPMDPMEGHAAALKAESVPDTEVRRRIAVVTRLLGERSDWIEIYFDKAFARPVTGNPARDGFASTPSAFLESAIKDVPPGRALDAGMGQGRNAIALAKRGWSVTGFDISGEAIAAARKNAEAAGVRIEATKASYADFDFGTAKWDAIVLAFAWAPVTDPAFVAKLAASLRPGGRVIFEHFIDDPARPRPAAIHALKPGELRELFKDLRIETYEEVEGVGDWGGPGARLVRMVAVRSGGTR